MFAALSWVGVALAVDLKTLEGVWVHSGAESELALRQEAIARTAATFKPLIRGAAETRLERSAPRPDGYDIVATEDQIAIGIRGQAPVTSVVDGPAVTVQPEGAEHPVTVQRSRADEGLISQVTGPNGVLVSRFEQIDQTLLVTYVVSGARLQSPLTYRLTFVREHPE